MVDVISSTYSPPPPRWKENLIIVFTFVQDILFINKIIFNIFFSPKYFVYHRASWENRTI